MVPRQGTLETTGLHTLCIPCGARKPQKTSVCSGQYPAQLWAEKPEKTCNWSRNKRLGAQLSTHQNAGFNRAGSHQITGTQNFGTQGGTHVTGAQYQPEINKNLCRAELTASQRAAAVTSVYAWAPAHRPINSAPGADLLAQSKKRGLDARPFHRHQAGHKCKAGCCTCQHRSQRKSPKSHRMSHRATPARFSKVRIPNPTPARPVRVFFCQVLGSIAEIVLHPPLHRTEKKKAYYRIDSRLSLCSLGWLMGLEPTTTGITILDSTN